MSARAAAAAAVRAVVTGVSGRMGSSVARLLRDMEGMALVGATERPDSPAVGQDAGEAARIGRVGISVEPDLRTALQRSGANVVIDFTSAAASEEHARICAEAGVAMVVGSTGFTTAQRDAISRHARRIPILVSPNMSIGVNVVFEVAADLARRLGEGFDVEIVESHHRLKKDAPSGTALKLAEEIARAVGRSNSNFRTTRDGQIGERSRSEIGIQSLRGGDAVGEHSILFLGDGERVELTHRATSRDQFARGALRAARWIIGRPPGQYEMQDVLRSDPPNSQ